MDKPLYLSDGDSANDALGFMARAVKIENPTNDWVTINGLYVCGPQTSGRILSLQTSQPKAVCTLTNTPPSGMTALPVSSGQAYLDWTDQPLADSPGTANQVQIGTLINAQSVSISGPVEIAGTPAFTIDGQTVDVSTVENQTQIAAFSCPTGVSNHTVTVPAWAQSLLCLAGTGVGDNGSTITATGTTTGTVNGLLAGSFNTHELCVLPVAPGSDPMVTLTVNNANLSPPGTLYIVASPDPLYQVLGKQPITTSSVGDVIVELSTGSGVVQVGNPLPVDRPVESWELIQAGAAGTPLNATQAAPGVGKQLVLTRATFTLFQTGASGGVISVLVNGKNLGQLSVGGTAGAIDHLQLQDCRMALGNNGALNVTSGTPGATATITCDLAGFVASV